MASPWAFVFEIAGRLVTIQTSLKDFYDYLSRSLSPHQSCFAGLNPKLQPSIFLSVEETHLKSQRRGRFVSIEGTSRNGHGLTSFSKRGCPVWVSAKIFFHGSFEPILQMMLRRIGIHPVHGIALYRGMTGILIGGPAGTGKTTTALHLVRQGWRLLNDDETYLVLRNKKVFVWACPGPLYLTPETVRRYRHLCGQELGPLVRKGQRKKYLWKNSGSKKSHYVPLRIILFPQVRSKEKTRLDFLDPKEILLSLFRLRSMEQLGILRDWDSASSAWRIFTQVAAQAKGARLTLGLNSERISETLSSFLPVR